MKNRRLQKILRTTIAKKAREPRIFRDYVTRPAWKSGLRIRDSLKTRNAGAGTIEDADGLKLLRCDLNSDFAAYHRIHFCGAFNRNARTMVRIGQVKRLHFEVASVVQSSSKIRHIISLRLDQTMVGKHGFPETRPSLVGQLGGPEENPSQWREFFDLYAPSVHRIARRHGLGAHDADDVTQQVMIAVARYADRFHYDRNKGRFRQWIQRITANKLSDYFRLQRRTPTFVPYCENTEHATAPDALWQEEWHRQDLLLALKRLRGEVSPKRYDAFRLYVIEGNSVAETGRRVGMTNTHVYVTRTQLIKRLRELMDGGEQGPGPC